MNSIESLDPRMQLVVRQFLKELDEDGIEHSVTSTLRTVAEQQAYFAQGRTGLAEVNRKRRAAGMYEISEEENRRIVTRCDGVRKRSRHQSGLAIDVVPAVNGNPTWPPVKDKKWKAMGIIGEKYGLEWGGRWVDPDCPHYELAP